MPPSARTSATVAVTGARMIEDGVHHRLLRGPRMKALEVESFGQFLHHAYSERVSPGGSSACSIR